jgi:uncharacterized protein YlbG (UPF0298 family)
MKGVFFILLYCLFYNITAALHKFSSVRWQKCMCVCMRNSLLTYDFKGNQNESVSKNP